MKRLFSFLLFVSVLATPLCAQYLTGRIVNRTGEPTPYVTVYISELRQGIITNTAGIFELAAPEGSYSLVITCMGYKTVRIGWQSERNREGELKIITLEEAEYQIPPVFVTAKKEDPAYTIMRKAIGMAPFYRNLVQSYTAEVYLKGNLNVTKLRGAVLLAMNREQRNAIKKLSGVHESVNEIQYVAPDKYTQTVKSEKTAANVDLKKLGINESDVQLGLANLNIYSNQPNMPLVPGAFQNYTFKFLGDSEIDGCWVAKISVTPRRKSDDLFTGFLYIVREKWSVQELDLSLSTSFGKARAQQTYRFVLGDVLLPVAYTLEGVFDAFGMGINGHTSGSIKYFDVQQNQRMAQNVPEEGRKVEEGEERSREQGVARQVEEILGKAELKPKDMRQLRKIQEEAVSLVREEERKARGERSSLLLENNYKIIRDSIRVQDSLYWAITRPTPLDRNELKVFQQSDSIKEAPYTAQGKRNKSVAMATGLLVSGYTFKIDSLWSLSYSGLINALEGGYNTVDGWVYSQALRVRKSTANNGFIQLRGRVSWAFCRQALMWNVLAEQRYWANKGAYWRLELFSQTKDFAGNKGVGMVNDWSSLLFRINPSRFYHGLGVDFEHRIEILDGLMWNVGFTWEERRPLSNHNDYSWFYRSAREFSPNIPDNNSYLSENNALIDQNRVALLRLELSYTPQQYYRTYQGRKVYRSSKYPTFSVGWIKGIPNLWESNAAFDFGRVQVAQSRDFGYHNNFEYWVEAGKFFNTKDIYFADFHHIYTNQTGVSLNRGLNALQLLHTYALSTPEWYVEGRVRYLTPFLALKYLPIFKSPFVREGLQVSYLLLPSLRHYTELGYSLNNLLMMFDVGVFVGFEQAHYRNWGFRLSVPIERLMRAVQL